MPAPQQECLLFCLPIELRELIYQHVFGPSLIHIQAVGRRLAHVRCGNWLPGDGWDGHRHGYRRGFEGDTVSDFAKDPNDQLIALCLSCRKMYVIALAPS